MGHVPGLPARRRDRWWSPFLAGAVAGVLLASLARRRPREAGVGVSTGAPDAESDDRWERWREAWDDVVEGAAGGLASARDLVGRRAPLDVDALQERVSGMACSRECRVRLLGEGIVEVVGACHSDDDARALLAELANQPGVEVVVNRVWTPESSDPGRAEPPH